MAKVPKKPEIKDGPDAEEQPAAKSMAKALVVKHRLGRVFDAGRLPKQRDFPVNLPLVHRLPNEHVGVACHSRAKLLRDRQTRVVKLLKGSDPDLVNALAFSF
jgi:hypothetical protein